MHSNHCIIYTENEFMNFTDNVIESRVLVIQPMNTPPFLFNKSVLHFSNNFLINLTNLQLVIYRKIGDTIYELCGPFMMIIVEFARSYKS